MTKERINWETPKGTGHLWFRRGQLLGMKEGLQQMEQYTLIEMIRVVRLGASPESDNFVNSFTQAVMTHITLGAPIIETAAEIAGTGVRTLPRRLMKEETSYRDIVDRARFKVALRSLENPDKAITDIAFDLSYRKLPGFTRAFRR